MIGELLEIVVFCSLINSDKDYFLFFFHPNYGFYGNMAESAVVKYKILTV